MKFKTLLNVLIIATVALGMLVSGFFNLDPISAQSVSASLTPTAGLVQYRTRGTAKWITVTQAQSITAGDQIRTGSNGLGVLTTANGIELTIYPSAIVQLSKLGPNAIGGQDFVAYQLAGTVLSNVQKKGSNDLVQIYLPPAGLTVEGTQFLTQVAPGIGGGVVGIENTVAMLARDGKKYTVAPDTLGYARLDAEKLSKVGINAGTLKANTTSNFNTIEGLRSFLKDMLVMYHTPDTRNFLTTLLKIPADSTIDEINAAIDTFKATIGVSSERLAGLNQGGISLSQILSQLTTNFWQGTYKASVASNPIAAPSCGNGAKDAGETADSCPDDFVDLSACGNGLCEETTKGESTFSCSVDCFPFLDTGLQAMTASESIDEEARNSGGAGNGSTPQPSGVGR